MIAARPAISTRPSAMDVIKVFVIFLLSRLSLLTRQILRGISGGVNPQTNLKGHKMKVAVKVTVEEAILDAIRDLAFKGNRPVSREIEAALRSHIERQDA
jgi:hypothetical protein